MSYQPVTLYAGAGLALLGFLLCLVLQLREPAKR
jgi:hypothetical protein